MSWSPIPRLRKDVAAEVGRAVRNGLNFRPDITLVEPGGLPRFEMKARRLVRRDAEHED